MQLEAGQLKKVVDPISNIIDLIHKLLFISYIPPTCQKDQRISEVQTFVRRVFRDKRNTKQIKSQLMKVGFLIVFKSLCLADEFFYR